MLVYACIGSDTRIIVKTEELKNQKDISHYKPYVFSETGVPGYLFGYPLYSSKTKIPNRLKRSCKIKAIKTFDKELQEAIKKREQAYETCKEVFGYRYDDPFDDFNVLNVLFDDLSKSCKSYWRTK